MKKLFFISMLCISAKIFSMESSEFPTIEATYDDISKPLTCSEQTKKNREAEMEKNAQKFKQNSEALKQQMKRKNREVNCAICLLCICCPFIACCCPEDCCPPH